MESNAAGIQYPDLPQVVFGRAGLGTMETALTREWLVTDGAGGYAMGTVAGATTRTYHALLIAAPRVPQERIALVTQCVETVIFSDGATVSLGVCENADGSFEPQGYSSLAGFSLDGLFPRFTFSIAPGLTLEKTLWMERGASVTYLRYRLLPNGQSPNGPIQLRLEPYCVCRSHHAAQHSAPGWAFAVESPAPNVYIARARPDELACRITGGAARFTAAGRWRENIEHRVERERGLDDHEDVYIPGAFTVSLTPGDTTSLVISAGAGSPALPGSATPGGPDHEAVVEAAYQRERRRQRALLTGATASADLTRRLTLAADQFIVGRRPAPTSVSGDSDNANVTVIAGYPWFTDWGRDTMIALPGLTLATGRADEARGLLRGFLAYMSQGMIPNRFPDSADAPPEYNTVDATLWLFHALDRYLTATGDWPLLSECFPALDSVIDWHVRGTRYGIQVDASDGLLRAGAEGVQLTWMDAKVDDWVVTPRSGKPVEISALWYHALTLMSAWSRRLRHEPGDIAVYDALAAQTRARFSERFWNAAGGYLNDVVDVNGQYGETDTSLRPNQVIALAVAPDLISPDQGRSALNVARDALLTPLGLRTLAPTDPNYHGQYGGDRRTRDSAYHQGTAWPWLLGVYADARAQFFPEEDARALRQSLLAPLTAHVREAGLGTISEIASGSAPYTPAGCPAQAWSVAEVLRLAKEE